MGKWFLHFDGILYFIFIVSFYHCTSIIYPSNHIKQYHLKRSISLNQNTKIPLNQFEITCDL